MIAVRLKRMTKNAPNVVRKMYQPIDPIAHPDPVWTSAHSRPARSDLAGFPENTIIRDSLDPSTKWPSQGAEARNPPIAPGGNRLRDFAEYVGRGALRADFSTP